MKKVRTIGLMLLALLALGAIASSAAFAETAKECEIAGKKLKYSLTTEANENGEKEADSWNTVVTIKFAEEVELMDT